MLGNPHICGGALLSYDPAYVLTAAHCVADAPSHPTDHSGDDNPYFVGYYDTNRQHQRTMRMADWVIHPSYNNSNTVDMNYDVAVVKLESPLKISNRIRRIALWSSEMTSPLPTQGDLVGFGYMDLEKKETQDMQKLKLNITRFMPKEPKMMVEARSDREEMIACHGDSGSPLVVHKTVTIPNTNEKVTVPFVAGNLARIFGAYDESPQSLTCPLPFLSSQSRNGTVNSVVESFCNTATMLEWISSVVGISQENLADPFY
ncbi:trypsin-like serine protease, partial [Backusella circina FSU 941]